MASRRAKLTALSAALVLGAGAYFLYSVLAVQGQGVLAQSPLNITSRIKPALIMAVDDSASMDNETVLPTNDGAAWWNAANDSFAGLDLNDNPAQGTLNFNRVGNTDATTWKKYVYVFPFGTGVDGRVNTEAVNDHFAIAPIPAFGWARAPSVNRAYFNPMQTYDPWLEQDGRFLQGVAGINAATGQVAPTSAPADPKRGLTRLNLTADFQFSGNANAQFTLHSGMSLPRGTIYNDLVTCPDGYGTFSTAAERTQDRTASLPSVGWLVAQGNRAVTGADGRARCSVAIRYFPATFYIPVADASTVATGIGYVATAIVDDGAVAPDGTALRRFEIRRANFVDSDTYQAAINNFANWFSYYRKRHQATRAGMSSAFAKSENFMRAGYFTINNRTAVTMRDMTLASDRKLLFDSIFSLTGAGGTPNKEAVTFMGEQFRRGVEAAANQPILETCQKNFGMLFTDGFSNNATTAINTNVDGSGAPFTNPVFPDGASGTMADIAAYYYKNDLRPDLADDVAVADQCSATAPDPRLDCQANQHMNFFGVTLNGRGLQYGVNLAATADPYTNVPTWPTAFYNRHPSAIDDLWHASINSRGRFLNASSPKQISDVMAEVLNAVAAANSPTGSLALTGARVGTGSLTYEPRYSVENNGTDWNSSLLASTVSLDADTREVRFTQVWDAADKLPSPANRRVWLGRYQGGAATDFNASNIGTLDTLCENGAPMAVCTSADLRLKVGGVTNGVPVLGPLFDPILLNQAVAYFKGNRDCEDGCTLGLASGTFRSRGTPLGDIVNSTPVVSAPTDDYGYRSLGGTYGTDYVTYLNSKRSNNRIMVYAGANDGMLHAFDGSASTTDGGVERFAFVPRTVLGQMGNLLYPYREADGQNQSFKHRYFVDGPIAVSDAYLGGNYQTVLVGSTGAGAKGVFALNVTNASSTSSNFVGGDRLWEISDRSTNGYIGGSAAATAIRQNIGYVLGRPVIVPVKVGSTITWKAIFGNGYNSTSGKAVLFMVDIATGNPRITMVEAAETGAPNTPSGKNGLGNVAVVDRWTAATDGTLTLRGRDGFADTVYAADQKGAIWKFDIRSATPANQTVPLFTSQTYTTGADTGYRQPILGGLTTTAGPNGSTLVFFGTGSFSFDGDPADKSLQSLYGVVDRATGSPQLTLTRADLLAQQITATADGARTLTRNRAPVGYGGWYVDLPTGERFVGYPKVENGLVFMPAYVPNSTASGCGSGGENWLYGLNALTGGAGLSNVSIGSPGGTAPAAGAGAIKLDISGTAPVKDVAVVAAPRPQPVVPGSDGIITPEELKKALAAECSLVVKVAGAKPLYLPRACGRQSWRQIL